MTHQLSQPEIGHIDPSRTSKSDGTSHLSDAKYLMYKSIDNLDAGLIANGYTAAQVAKMTLNDKQYAVSLLNV